MHQPPAVNDSVLELLRARLAWGMLGLEQPPGDLLLSLHHFAFQWGASQPPPPLQPWQTQVLQEWRQHHSQLANLSHHPVLDTLVQCLRMEDGQSLDGWFHPTLFRLARHEVSQADLKPALRACWQQISLGVQRLRQGAGPFSQEGEGVLRATLQALQQLQTYFQNPDVRYLDEAGWRWCEALREWDQVANLCLSGLQPATSAIYWGQLLEGLPPGELDPELLNDHLIRWFQNWSCDFVYCVAPYQHQILGLEKTVTQFGMALLRWQKLLPGWQGEVGPAWATFLDELPARQEDPPVTHIFRWIQPDRPIQKEFVALNPWRSWLKKASLGPPGGASKREGERLQTRMRLSRLLTTLVQDSFRRHQKDFPELAFAQDAGEWVAAWLEGYDPLTGSTVSLVEQRLTELEATLLRDFPVPDRIHPTNVV